MFTDAKTANDKTKEVIKNIRIKAKEWAESEWEFVDIKIEEAIKRGEFETSYWWSNELLEDAGVIKGYAAEALAEKAYSLGFVHNIDKCYSNNNVLRIEVRWLRV